MKTVHLPAYRLAIFDGEDDAAAAQRLAEQQQQRDADAQRQRDADAQRQRDADAAAAKKRDDDAAAAKKRDDDAAALRNQRGQFESREDYENRIKALNDENAERRRENRELKGSLTVLERRAIRADVLEAVRAANPFDENAVPDIVDSFMSEMAEHIKVDPKTGNTIGLEKLGEWKSKKSYFFKPEESAEAKATREAAEKKAADEKAAAERRGNRTAGSASRGSGTGEGTDTGGLPDLRTLKTPAERAAALEQYKRGLRGANSTYAKASSVKP